MAVLKPLLTPDAVVCTDGGRTLEQAVKDPGVKHHRAVTISGADAIDAWHTQNANFHHAPLEGWMRRFQDVATAYLESCLGWFGALGRTPRSHRRAAQLLNLAIGAAPAPAPAPAPANAQSAKRKAPPGNDVDGPRQ